MVIQYYDGKPLARGLRLNNVICILISFGSTCTVYEGTMIKSHSIVFIYMERITINEICVICFDLNAFYLL